MIHLLVQLRRQQQFLRATGLSAAELSDMDGELVEQLIVANAAWEAAEAERIKHDANRPRLQ